jgi:hypothetical protein
MTRHDGRSPQAPMVIGDFIGSLAATISVEWLTK